MSKFSEIMLGELASQEKRSIISGPFGSDIGTEFFQSSGVPVIRGNNLTTDSRKFVDQGFAFVTAEKADALNAYARRQDIVLTAAGTIGQVGIIPENSTYSQYVISNKQLRIRIDQKKANPYYVYYWLASPWILKTIIGRNTGSTVPLINLGTLRGLPVRIPKERSAQDKIANFISTIDDKIEINHRINSELEGMAKLLYDYWFVQYDFPLSAAQAAALGKPRLAGKPYRTSGGPMVYHEQLKREIPEAWEVRELESFMTLAYGKALKKTDHQSGPYPVYGSGGIYGWHHEALVAGPGIIVGRKGTVGSIHWEDHDFYPTDTTYFVIPTDGYPLIYLALLLKTLDLDSMNTDSAVPGLNRNNAYSREVACPPMDLVKAFTEIVKPMRTMMSSLAQQNQELTTLRDWLLPMLMNGQVKVR